MSGDSYLREIRKDLKAGEKRWRMYATLLDVFGYVRRRQTAVSAINTALKKHGLRTDPEITTTTALEVPRIRFLLKAEPLTETGEGEKSDDQPSTPDEGSSELLPFAPFRIKELLAEDQDVLMVRLDELADVAITKMLLNDYSQLVVEDGHKNFKGMVTFKSIVIQNWHSTKSSHTVEECLDPDAAHIPESMEVSEAINQFQDRDAIAVTKDNSLQIVGIVTSFDFAHEFTAIVEPFKLLQEIERGLATRIAPKFDQSELHDLLRSEDQTSKTTNVSDLAFGEMVRLIQNHDHWDRLGLKCDQTLVLGELDWAGSTRNSMMHFRVMPSKPVAERLRKLVNMFRCLPAPDNHAS